MRKMPALAALLGVAMWSVACGKSPTAVETGALVPDGDGVATATRVPGARTPAQACTVASIEVKAYASTPLSNDGDRRLVSFRAVYLDAAGNSITPVCDEPPAWVVTPLTNGMSFYPARFDPFEARLVAGKGAYVVTAIGPGKISGETKVGW